MSFRSPLGGPSRKADGSAGDADYASIGTVYRDHRVADPRIAAFVHAALGDAHSVLNIGAGTGSYEPTDRQVTAVEPSATMRERRPPHLGAAIDAYAEQLRSWMAALTPRWAPSPCISGRISSTGSQRYGGSRARSITSKYARVGPSGSRFPCSQWRSVLMLNPNRAANACCVIPNFVRMAFTSTCTGTCTRQFFFGARRFAWAMASSRPLRMLFAALLMIVTSRTCSRARPSTRFARSGQANERSE
jgi:hypothetical protein